VTACSTRTHIHLLWSLNLLDLETASNFVRVHSLFRPTANLTSARPSQRPVYRPSERSCLHEAPFPARFRAPPLSASLSSFLQTFPDRGRSTVENVCGTLDLKLFFRDRPIEWTFFLWCGTQEKSFVVLEQKLAVGCDPEHGPSKYKDSEIRSLCVLKFQDPQTIHSLCGS